MSQVKKRGRGRPPKSATRIPESPCATNRNDHISLIRHIERCYEANATALHYLHLLPESDFRTAKATYQSKITMLEDCSCPGGNQAYNTLWDNSGIHVLKKDNFMQHLLELNMPYIRSVIGLNPTDIDGTFREASGENLDLTNVEFMPDETFTAYRLGPGASFWRAVSLGIFGTSNRSREIAFTVSQYLTMVVNNNNHPRYYLYQAMDSELRDSPPDHDSDNDDDNEALSVLLAEVRRDTTAGIQMCQVVADIYNVELIAILQPSNDAPNLHTVIIRGNRSSHQVMVHQDEKDGWWAVRAKNNDYRNFRFSTPYLEGQETALDVIKVVDARLPLLARCPTVRLPCSGKVPYNGTVDWHIFPVPLEVTPAFPVTREELTNFSLDVFNPLDIDNSSDNEVDYSRMDVDIEGQRVFDECFATTGTTIEI